MGKQKSTARDEGFERRHFLKYLLNDLEALDLILKKGLIEKDRQRIGAEQELSLVNKYFKPSRVGPSVLNRLNDTHFTTELALYNLEINLDPLELKDQCFSLMEKQLRQLLGKVDEATREFGSQVILTGILPSIDIRSGQMDHMTPNPRYLALGEVIKKLRGQDFELNIQGVDELILAHTNILFEACNTSFQCHLQVSAEDFVDQYNWAQLISGPVLAICTNSPLLFGRELWSETRIPLFQQSIDIRSKGYHLRERQQRVSFGDRWIREITEIYKEDIARFTLILTNLTEEDSLKTLESGKIPRLKALNLHNGTIWKWNRPCYGVTEGVPHLRIENRYLPAGPSVVDEIANFAFWVGLMKAMPQNYRRNWGKLSFEDTKGNFYKAATAGIQSSMIWEGKVVPALQLVVETLISMAREGLASIGISQKDSDKYLSIIDARARSGRDGSSWLTKSFRKMKKEMNREEAMVAVTAAMQKRRMSRQPIHQWSIATAKEGAEIPISYDWIGSVMSTDLITVQEEDLVELVAKIMTWRDIRHIPVEDDKGNLKGLVTRKNIDRHLAEKKGDALITAKEIMQKDLITIGPTVDAKYAMLLMVDKKISCLPVVEGNHLIGLITDKDTQEIWKKLQKNVE
ncbi:CBS domain-containing protein [Lunatibacter salilacus]|uniref:CBS domain-containing protein n=1 Tax=Lunatibacter salilacus TaxID=2483804 RepID=UPI00131B99F7|nr:CBS domain-containing protein [Lunatibacter salilacus]